MRMYLIRISFGIRGTPRPYKYDDLLFLGNFGRGYREE